jgi:hypothetical protein
VTVPAYKFLENGAALLDSAPIHAVKGWRL